MLSVDAIFSAWGGGTADPHLEPHFLREVVCLGAILRLEYEG